MYQIILADGTEFAADWCGAAGGVLNARIRTETGFAELAAIFSRAEATMDIAFSYGDMTDVFTGYTQPILLQDQRWQDSGVLVQLRREA